MFDGKVRRQPSKLARNVILPALFASSLVFASGDGGGGGGAGGSGGGSGGSGGGAGESSFLHSQMSYEKGKKIFLEKVVCEVCPYADLELEKESIKKVWPDLKKDIKRSGRIGKDLRFSERSSLRRYILKRFRI